MNVRTYDLHVLFQNERGGDYSRIYYNISRVAVNRFVEWHRQNPDYCHHNLFFNR